MSVTTVPMGKPCWSRSVAIGDYGGALNKEDCTSEAIEPYAAQWYRELHAMRGSAYSITPYTLVDAENIAIARLSAAVWSRTPEKVRANATPLRSDEKLEYWVEVLGVSTRFDDQRWQIRDRCVANYKASNGPTTQNIEDSLSALLGNALVEVHYQTGVDLDTPPSQTFWPGVNPGTTTYSLGGGAWMSERSHLWVETVIPSGMSIGDYLTLINVNMFQLLDTLLPCWATFNASNSDDGGFLLDISMLDYTGITPS